MNAGTLHSTLVIARYDLQGLLRERGTWVLLLSLIGVAWFAIWQGDQHQRTQVAAAATAKVQADTATQNAVAVAQAFFADPDAPKFRDLRAFRNPADIRGYAFRERVEFAIKPSLAGGALAIGQSDVLPSYVRVQAESMDSAKNGNEIEHPLRLAAGRLDLSFVVVYLWPLVLLSFTASAVVAEREDRRVLTLRLQGVTHGVHVVGQVAGRGLFAACTFAVSVIACTSLMGAVPGNALGAVALGQWLLVFAAYTAFWLGIAMLIASRASQRGSALFAGFGVWLATVIVVPALLTAAVDTVVPWPSREGYQLAVRDAVDRINADRVAMAERFYDQHPEWRPKITAPAKVSPAVLRLTRAIELERGMASVEAQFDAAREQRRALHARLRLASPATIAHEAFTVIAGNDAARHAQFMASVRGHQLALRAYFQTRLQQSALADEQSPCKHVTGTCASGFGFTGHLSVPRYAGHAALQEVPAIPPTLFVLVLLAALSVFVALIRRK
jgi:ABC-2 type transport system permease protein